ncbi:MAG TPA: YrzE family protein [Chloroflexia bacterium]|nr:YrzE family protein [Chloroflexia bacterium]
MTNNPNNPAFDPRLERENREQQRADERYLREMQNNQQAYNQGAYNQQSYDRGTYNQQAYNQGYTQGVQNQYARSVAQQPVVAVPVTSTTTTVAAHDDVRWGPILAGLFSTLATLLILSLLGVAVGLTAASGQPGGATGAANNANSYTTGAGIWAAVSALIAFFIGGYVAGRTAGVRRRSYGWVNGALVWAITLPLLLWLAGSGASGFLNAIGFNLAGFTNNITGAVNNATNNPGAVNNATDAARNGAWIAFAALIIGLIASALGGLLGSRNRYDAATPDTSDTH